MEKVVVLGLTSYRVTDRETGEINEGWNMHYINDYSAREIGNITTQIGSLPFKVPIQQSMFKDISKLDFPSVCNIHIKKIPNSKGQAKEVIVKIEYLEHLNVEEILLAAPSSASA